MTTISGKILNSDGQPVSPTQVSVKLAVPTPVGSDAQLPAQVEFVAAVDGSLSVDLDSSVTGVGYLIKIVMGDPVLYTEDWFPLILRNEDPLTWAEVLPSLIPNVRPDFDRTIGRIAQQIASNPDLLNLFRDAIGLKPIGQYSSLGFYSAGDVVFFQGNSFSPRRRGFINNIQPPSSAIDSVDWVLVAQQGTAGTGQTGDNSAYNQVAWLADTVKPPTKSAVAGKFATVDAALASTAQLGVAGTWTAQQNFSSLTAASRTFAPDSFVYRGSNLAAQFAPLASPTFTGTPQTPTAPIASIDTTVASTAFVKEASAQAITTAIRAAALPNAFVEYRGLRFVQNTTGSQVDATITANPSGTLLRSLTIDQYFIMTNDLINNGQISVRRVPGTGGLNSVRNLITFQFNLTSTGANLPSTYSTVRIERSYDLGATWAQLEGSVTWGSGALVANYNLCGEVAGILNVLDSTSSTNPIYVRPVFSTRGAGASMFFLGNLYIKVQSLNLAGL